MLEPYEWKRSRTVLRRESGSNPADLVDYAALVHKFNGQVVKISSSSTNYINPMDINLNYSEDDNPVALKADFILSLCELIMGSKDGLQPIEKTVIDRCVHQIYQRYFDNPAPENMPILEDLYDALLKQDEKEAHHVATALEIYVKGSLKLFNNRTNVDAEAKKRKLQVEYEQESGTFIPPSAKTVNDLLDEYMSIYGVNTWAMSTYESRKSLIANYIRPLIGDMKLEDVTPRIMDKYYRDLLSVKAVSSKYVKARTEYLTPHTVREVHKTLRNAFNQAVKWELMTRNPVEHATLPKEEHKTRDIWTAEVLQKALEACDDDILRLAINLAFSCSLRIRKWQHS